MLRHYGPQHWWPGDTCFEIMAGAVLTQATSWTNAAKAISNLKAVDSLTPRAIRSLSHKKLAALIYPCGYYNSKAQKLKALAEYLGQRFNDDLEAMSNEKIDVLRPHPLGQTTLAPLSLKQEVQLPEERILLARLIDQISSTAHNAETGEVLEHPAMEEQSQEHPRST